MNPPLLLFSTNTWMAYSVAERWYDGLHYAWCSPVYDGRKTAAHVNIPPSSSPAEIYRRLQEDAARGDRHSDAISQNKEGIYRGVKARLRQGLIDEADIAEIRASVERAKGRDYRPVLFVIPYEQVKGSVIRVPVADRAHPMSVEYRVDSLPRASFDMIELAV